MTAEQNRQAAPADAVFTWHPQYRGRRLVDLRRDLESEIGRDQRTYELALSGAEESEHDALASVVDVDRRWSLYHFGWNDANPADVADRIVAFEWEREQRQEMIAWKDYRNADQGTPSTSRGVSAPRAPSDREDWRALMDDPQRRKLANTLAGVVVALIMVAIIVVVVLVL